MTMYVYYVHYVCILSIISCTELEETLLHTVPQWRWAVSAILWKLWRSPNHSSQRCGCPTRLPGHQQGPGPQVPQTPLLCTTAASDLLLFCLFWVRYTFWWLSVGSILLCGQSVADKVFSLSVCKRPCGVGDQSSLCDHSNTMVWSCASGSIDHDRLLKHCTIMILFCSLSSVWFTNHKVLSWARGNPSWLGGVYLYTHWGYQSSLGQWYIEPI